MTSQKYDLICIGGGAAGFFGAINFAELYQQEFQRLPRVAILEASSQILKKVRISGGGRCNITNQLEDPRELIKNYPRGGRSLTNAFFAFGPKQMKQWLQQHQLEIKTEPDGRVFPLSNSSQSVIELFQRLQMKYKIDLLLGHRTSALEKLATAQQPAWRVSTQQGEFHTGAILMATGSSTSGHQLMRALGVPLTELAPSLFTFKSENSHLKKVPGLSVQSVKLTLLVDQKKFTQVGPILMTHWGFSGPAVIKLSALAARELATSKYQGQLLINWFPEQNSEQLFQSFKQLQSDRKKLITNSNPPTIAKRLWLQLLDEFQIQEKPLSEQKDKSLRRLAEQLCRHENKIVGKGEFKEEFVTCGGVSLKEINPKSFESKQFAGLYFAGEVLDIDGLTGGFNFQNAWTSSYLAASDLIGKMKA